jgi:uncharacterized membrane protein
MDSTAVDGEPTAHASEDPPADTEGTEGTDDLGSRLSAAKEPAGIVGGLSGQPLHPLFVTIPVGAWVCSFGFDLAAHFAHEEVVYSRAAFWLIGFGIIGGVAAAVTGLVDLVQLPRHTQAYRTCMVHMATSDVALVAFVISFLLRRGSDSLHAATKPVMLLSVIALAALAVSAWLGIRLAYRYGVRVAPESVQLEGYR